MRVNLITILTFSLLVFGCRKEKNDIAVSECIQSEIKKFSTNTCEKGATVKQYFFQGQIVYTFSMGSCGGDLPTFVKDETCNHLGFLGGITGNTKINGEEFSKAEFKRTVWAN